jgi:hypothetical protein
MRKLGIKIIELNQKAENLMIGFLDNLAIKLKQAGCRHDFKLYGGHAGALILICKKCGYEKRTGCKSY